MPHCVIEHSVDINSKELISSVHKAALAANLFDAQGSDIKVRALPYENHKTGSVDISFVHVTLRILSGRTTEQKSLLTQQVLEQLSALSITQCSISVEVVDIDRISYAKVIV